MKKYNPLSTLGISPLLLESMSVEEMREFIISQKRVFAKLYHPENSKFPDEEKFKKYSQAISSVEKSDKTLLELWISEYKLQLKQKSEYTIIKEYTQEEDYSEVRNVMLSSKFEKTLRGLANIKTNDEVHGVLVYVPQSKYCTVSYLMVSAIGTPGLVIANEKIKDVINQFGDLPSEYRLIRFHTHSNKTIQARKNLAYSFSKFDLSVFSKQIALDEEFIGMIVTPKTMRLYAADMPLLKVVEQHPFDLEKIIKIEIEQMAKAQGVSLPILKIK